MIKKLLLTLFVLLSVLFLVSCTDNNADGNDDIKTEYTITFITNGGTEIDSVKFYNSFDSSELDKYITQKDGFEFVSWHTSFSLSDESKANGTYTKSTIFYAKWKELIEEEIKYTIKFLNDDNTLLLELLVLENELPVYSGSTPTKESDELYTYEFKDWDKEIIPATKDETYVAVYEKTLIEVEPVNNFNPSQLNQTFGFNIYSLIPEIVSNDYRYYSDEGEDYKGLYIDLLDWTLEIYEAYETKLEQLIGSDLIVNGVYVFPYIDHEDDGSTIYGISFYLFNEVETTKFDPTLLNQTIGFDIYKLLPEIVTFDYSYEIWPENDDEIAIEIILFDWDFEMADYYDSLLNELYYWDTDENAFYIQGAYVTIFYDNTINPTLYSIGVYRYKNIELPEEPTEGVYYSFNMQNIGGLDSYNYEGNIDIELTLPYPTNNLKVYGSQVMNVTGSAASGLTPGVTFAAYAKGNDLAYVEFIANDTITSISFEMIAETNFASNLIDAYLVSYKDGLIYKTINFYDEVDKELKTITINGIDSTHFGIYFEGAGTSGNRGRFMINKVTLYNQTKSYDTFEEVLDVLSDSFNDENFNTYFPIVDSVSNLNIEKVSSVSYKITADFDETNYTQAINNYYAKLLTYGFTLNDNIYSYSLSETRSYNIHLKMNGDILEIYIYLTSINEYEKIDSFKSINDFQIKIDGFSGLPSIGDIDVLVIPIELKDQPFDSDYLAVLDLVFNGSIIDTGWESVSSYYTKSSFGKLNLSFDITPKKYTTNNNSSYYESFGDMGDQVIIEELIGLIDSDIDFSNYDFNNDGIIDSVIFVYSLEYVYPSEDENLPWWAWVYLPEEDLYYESYDLDNKELGYYMWASYEFIFDELNDDVLYNAETFIHELGHLIGLMDYYSNSFEYSTLGGFDMMDYNVGDHGPVSKLLLGWMNPILVSNGSYDINLDSYALYESNLDQVILVPKNYNSFDREYGFDEYLLIMYYEPKGLYEAHSIYSVVLEYSGIVIYHVKAQKANNPDFWEIFKYQNLEEDNHYFVSILEVDKNNSLLGDEPISMSDILTHGSVDLSGYKWSDGSKINVEVILNNMQNSSASISLNIN